MQYDVTGCVIFKSNQIEYLENKAVTKILSKKLYSDFNWSFQCNKKIVGENFVS